MATSARDVRGECSVDSDNVSVGESGQAWLWALGVLVQAGPGQPGRMCNSCK